MCVEVVAAGDRVKGRARQLQRSERAHYASLQRATRAITDTSAASEAAITQEWRIGEILARDKLERDNPRS